MIALNRAVHRRLARLRSGGRDGSSDSGFALIFVMLVTMLVTLGTASMLAVVANSVAPARHSQDSEAALAAAQAGIQNYVATLNQKCISYSVQACPWLLTQKDTPLTPTRGSFGTLSKESYSTKAQNYSDYLLANDGDLRLTSVGTSNGVSETLVADVSGNPSPLRYAYFSDYETVSGDFIARYAPNGAIPITSSAARSALGSASTTVTWTGLTDGGTSICNEHYYNDPATGAAGRKQSSAGADDAANPSLITQTGTNTGPNLNPSIPIDCEVTFSDGMSFNGPVYSQDALLLSNGTAASSTGPVFNSANVPFCGVGQTPGTATPCETIYPATTGWSTAYLPGNVAGTPYRSIKLVGGSPSPTGSVFISPTDLSLPASNSNAASSATVSCAGPASITLLGSTVTLSSNCSQTSIDLSKVAAASVYVASHGTTGPSQEPCGNSSYPADITTYSTTAGDACISGSLNSSATGKLSIVAAHDVIVTGDLKTTNTTTVNAFGEKSLSSGAAIDLVAKNNVLLYNPVKCATGSAIPNAAVVDSSDPDSPTYAYCPNDITGLYNANGLNGQPSATAVVSVNGSQESLSTAHPARQYCNKTGNSYPCSGTSSTCDYVASSATGATNAPRTIDAAVFALNGSLTTDNYNRGCALGTAQVNGGVYENHRGAVGEEWEVPNSATVSQRAYSGYKLQINYVSYQDAQLPYVPSLQAGAPNSPWIVLALSTGSGS